MNKRFLLSIQRTIVFVKGRIPAPGKETHLFNCLRPIYDFLFKPTPIGEGLLSNIGPLGKNCAAVIEDRVNVRVRQRSTHPRRTQMSEKPADLTEPGDLGQVLEDELRYLSEKTVNLGGKWQRRRT